MEWLCQAPCQDIFGQISCFPSHVGRLKLGEGEGGGDSVCWSRDSPQHPCVCYSRALGGSWREACCVPRAAFSFGFPTATSHENKLKKQHISLLLLFQASQGQSCRRASRRGDRAGTLWGRGRERGGTLGMEMCEHGNKTCIIPKPAPSPDTSWLLNIFA